MVIRSTVTVWQCLCSSQPYFTEQRPQSTGVATTLSEVCMYRRTKSRVGTICGFRHPLGVCKCIPCRWGDDCTHTHLWRARSPTCSGQNLGSLCYSGFNNQNNNCDGDEHSLVDDEELPEKSERADRHVAGITAAELWDWGSRWIYQRKGSIVSTLPPPSVLPPG